MVEKAVEGVVQGGRLRRPLRRRFEEVVKEVVKGAV